MECVNDIRCTRKKKKTETTFGNGLHDTTTDEQGMTTENAPHCLCACTPGTQALMSSQDWRTKPSLALKNQICSIGIHLHRLYNPVFVKQHTLENKTATPEERAIHAGFCPPTPTCLTPHISAPPPHPIAQPSF